MNDSESDSMIGGIISKTEVPATLIDTEDDHLTRHEREALWDLFVQIGRCWGNFDDDSASIRSSWLEFVQAKTEYEPSYVGEYANAVSVIQELVEVHGRENAFTLLFFRNGIPPGAPITRLAHCKRYVVDEFIRMQIAAGGFKGFGNHTGRNYKGYVGGSRYNRIKRVRAYEPDGGRHLPVADNDAE